MWVEILNVMHWVFWLTGAVGWAGFFFVCLYGWRQLGNRLSDPVELIDASQGVGQRLTALAEYQRPLASLPMQDLLDKAIDARAELQVIERAVCRKFQIEPGDGSDTNDLIVAAVYDGQSHNDLLSEYHKRTYGSRWIERRPMPYWV